MDMESSCPLLSAKKLWKTFRIALKLSKSSKQPSLDVIHLMMFNRTTTANTKQNSSTKHNRKPPSTGGGGRLQHQSSFSCKSDVDVRYSFVSPKEYEFSCKEDSPSPFPFRHITNSTTSTASAAAAGPTTSRRRNRPPTVNHRKYKYQHNNKDDTQMIMSRKALEMKKKNYAEEEEVVVVDQAAVLSSLSPLELPGFGDKVRELRVTDSPFPVNVESEEERFAANREAEEFIRNFRRDLRRQNSVAAAVESRYYGGGYGGGGRLDDYYCSYDYTSCYYY